ncbi:WD40 repeat-like-containing domain protein [Cordyceps fumosorosea ARSEF 2679]|uniref:WD40 repeat-like-containing domain protein n=1 Tax=Cordyceps fumosorosea (strain ARSEF 2679) TaxID=1081104 RepID=A0A167LS22_CORFA|nr:WD40 repeat-like-containing domain protein [Cordyceps fumosorosea ARSEF 2679]OAA53431.1 WD40 repeat-like-containing domain protein [Cordyceps fumosorosea ARSEF 2679]
MPKVKCYSAAWLSKNAPGHQLFEPSPEVARGRSLASPYATKKKLVPQGPRRTIARRGTEVFVAVGKEIRWGDLAYLKDRWADSQARERRGSSSRIKREDSTVNLEDIPEFEAGGGLRTIKVPVADDIRQLIISPNTNLLAILTTHTIHICTIPDSTHLTSEDTAPLKPKIFTLGPTTHVTSRSPIMSALWHPLGVNGSCVVTVTADAIVRVWELSTADRWSFDTPTTSIDLKKLADGTTLDQDFSASTSATNKAFSPDSFEMEVATASFASKGTGGWNPMTLWVAMREGDVYALCPLLPQRWAPPPTLIPSLSVSIVATVGSIEDDASVDESEKLLAQQQLQWMGDLDSQEPQIVDSTILGDPPVEVYTRPSRPGIIPRLQGPFDLISDPETGDELDTSVTDIMVIGKKTETDDLMLGEDEYELDLDAGDQEGLSLAVICLLSTSGQVRVYLDMDGIQAQWLPPKNKSKSSRLTAEAKTPSLLAFQAIDTMTPVEVTEESWPVFSDDALSRYSFFVTHHAGITFVSLASWIFRLEGELSGDYEAGTDFRLGLLVNSQSSRERIYAQPASDAAVPLAGCVALRDPDVGYFLLSATPYEPIAVIFESPEMEVIPVDREVSPEREREASMAPLDFYEPRPVYNPPHAFDQGSALPLLLERLRTSRHKTIVTQEVKLSPLTLQIFTDAHKVLSDETYKLGVSAAEIFRRCELLQSELKQQVTKANEVKGKIDAINGVDRDDESDNVMYERRISEARKRQEAIVQRVENLRKIVGKATTRDLSNKERAFMEEVRTLSASVSGPEATEEEGRDVKKQAQELWKRLDSVKRLQSELVADVEALKKSGQMETTTSASSSSATELRIPQDIRRSKLQQVQGLLSRETALVDAVTSRLERLQATV